MDAEAVLPFRHDVWRVFKKFTCERNTKMGVLRQNCFFRRACLYLIQVDFHQMCRSAQKRLRNTKKPRSALKRPGNNKVSDDDFGGPFP